jgi:ribosomal protein L32
MELDKQIRLGHLLLSDRKCKKCGMIKNLVDDFYRTRKYKGPVPSSYSYECKECTKKRILNTTKKDIGFWQYPDW